MKNEEPEIVHMEIPRLPNGDLNFEPAARGILSTAWTQPQGQAIRITNAWADSDLFLGWYDGHGGLDVFGPCLETGFGASIFLELEKLSPSMV